jgi:hypothetical protein
LIRSYRHWFNSGYSERKHHRFLAILQESCGEPALFRHSETPVFLPAALIEKMARYGREMVEQLLANPQYQADSRAAIPAGFRTPNEAPAPLFVQADFGLDADLEPKLVEIQGFPTLYAYQPLMAAAYREAYGIDADLAALPDGLTLAEYQALLRRAIVADCDPENVVLMEIDPWQQKTRHDFILTERMLGVRTVDIAAVRKEGRRLFYEHGGKTIPIRRIYNRAIVDELVRRGIRTDFDFRDELDVEWAGHPNWFFRLSKFSLPYLNHPAVPRTRFLLQVDRVENPDAYVLKPLYSFAGTGVIVGPTAEQIAAVPEEQRGGYILQERVDFRPVIETPFGANKIEVRVMYLWLDRLRPVNTIIRMGRKWVWIITRAWIGWAARRPLSTASLGDMRQVNHEGTRRYQSDREGRLDARPDAGRSPAIYPSREAHIGHGFPATPETTCPSGRNPSVRGRPTALCVTKRCKPNNATAKEAVPSQTGSSNGRTMQDFRSILPPAG